MSLQGIRKWGRENPEKLAEYMARNDSYVFFVEIDGNPRGSLNLEVQGERTIATDKALFPRGGLVFVATKTKGADQTFHRFMLDQDTGGAIRTAGRADLYLGVGPDAEARAGRVMTEGQMYYLFLDEDRMPHAAP
jgi:membrane-bound lytic murein transglycosylase A